MSIWTRISEAIAALTSGEGLAAVFDRLRNGPLPERSIGFTIGVIALGAKMAKADGEVTRDEVATFRRIFHIAPEEEANAARVYNLARQDVAGFEHYASKIAQLFNKPGLPLCADDRNVLIDILEGLFQVALSDGSYHPAEDAFLAEVARIFGLDQRCFSVLRGRFVEGAPRDPFDVLGIPPDADVEAARQAWRIAVKESHPDVMIARGVPAEAVKLAERRLIAINAAWHEIQSRVAA
ncbi:MAG: TerB family tellurite resistance protein [Cypionkella sp.]|jgi:DnaJ like chaperone protein